MSFFKKVFRTGKDLALNTVTAPLNTIGVKHGHTAKTKIGKKHQKGLYAVNKAMGAVTGAVTGLELGRRSGALGDHSSLSEAGKATFQRFKGKVPSRKDMPSVALPAGSKAAAILGGGVSLSDLLNIENITGLLGGGSVQTENNHQLENSNNMEINLNSLISLAKKNMVLIAGVAVAVWYFFFKGKANRITRKFRR